MIFCSECFQDPEIRSIIIKSGRAGSCRICGSRKGFVYNTDVDTSLSGLFDSVLSVYTAENNLPTDYPNDDLDFLGEKIKKDWDIFADISTADITKILTILSPSMLEDYPELFTRKVGIPEKYDEDYLKHHSILRTRRWEDFVQAIKHKNRFHTNLIDTELLREYCMQITEIIPVDNRRFYRGRIAHNSKGYLPKEMGAPPIEKATAGRANSAGISRLYLADSRETTFHEIRAAEYDYVTIGTFKLLEPIKVVNLSRIGKSSPFLSGGEVDCTALVINREHLQKINQEIARTMRSGDSILDYIPTQYICDYVMSICDDAGYPMFDGIRYKSVMHSSGSNLTIFYPNKFKCTSRRTYEVTKLQYTKTPIK